MIGTAGKPRPGSGGRLTGLVFLILVLAGFSHQSLSVVPAHGGWRDRRLWRRILRPSARVALGGGFRRAGHGLRGHGLSRIDGIAHTVVPPPCHAAARRCPRRGGLVCFRPSRSNRGILSLVYRRPSRRPCRGGRGCETLSGKPPRFWDIRLVSHNRAGAALRPGPGQPSDRGDSRHRRRAVGSGGRGGQKSFLRRRAEVLRRSSTSTSWFTGCQACDGRVFRLPMPVLPNHGRLFVRAGGKTSGGRLRSVDARSVGSGLQRCFSAR